MNKEFIPYEQALELKELGFDEPCAAKYNKGSFQSNSLGTWIDYNDSTYGASLISAPLYQQAFRWFREKHQLDYWVRAWWEFDRNIFIGYEALIGKGEHCGTYQFYEDAELACLKKLIEIVKNK